MKRNVPLAMMAVIASMLAAGMPAIGRAQSGVEPPPSRARLGASPVLEYRLLATKRTSTMQKELNEAAAGGFRFLSVMKGETGFAGDEIVSILVRESGSTTPRYEYRLLATSKTSTMQKELQEAGDAGFEYRDQTVHGEVMTILERDLEAEFASKA